MNTATMVAVLFIVKTKSTATIVALLIKEYEMYSYPGQCHHKKDGDHGRCPILKLLISHQSIII